MAEKLKSVAMRREHNRRIAVRLAQAGLYVLPVNSQKHPMIPSYQVSDASLSADQVETIREAHYAKHGREPLHVGSTCDVATVRAIWNKCPDAVPAIAAGPSGLAVIDADKKHDGPAKLAGFIKARSIKIDGAAITETASGGLHIIVKNDGSFTNVSGEMKQKLGCDIRGIGGQFLAPGAWLEDDRKYTPMAVAANLCDAVVLGTLPDMPREFAELIGAGGSADQLQGSTLKERASTSAAETSIRDALIVGTMPDGAVLATESAFGYDLQSLAEKYPLVAAAVSDDAIGAVDHSAARFALVSAWKSEGATDLEIAAMLYSGAVDVAGRPVLHKVVKSKEGISRLIEAKPGAGFFDVRAVARDISRAHVHKDHSSLFGAVDDEEREATLVSIGKTIWAFDAYNDYKPMEWAVAGLVPAQGVVVLHGAANAGKSFLALDLLDHLKRGKAWFGRDVVPGNAMYLCAEGQYGLGSRIRALYDERPIASRFESFAIRGDLPTLGDKPAAGAAKIKKMILAASNESGDPIKVVVVDNLAQLLGSGVEENAGLTPLFRALSDVANDLKLVFVVLHHDKKDGNGYRGSSTIRDACDAMLSVTEDANGVRTVGIGKMRDSARTKEAITFRLKIREVGVNQFGKPVTSCVVVAAKGDASAALAVVVDEDAPTIPVADDASDRAAAIVELVRKVAPAYKAASESVYIAGPPIAALLKAWNEERKGRVNIDGVALLDLDRTQINRAAKRAVELGHLRAVKNRLYLVDPKAPTAGAG